MSDAARIDELDFSRWRAVLDRVALLGALVADMPLEETLVQTERLDTLGPILEPTAYRDGGVDRVEDARALLRPLLEFQAAVRELRSRSNRDTSTEGEDPCETEPVGP